MSIQGAQDVLDSDEDDGTKGGGAAWISGPVGSGKTAAVAAVAQELGLQVHAADARTKACMHAWPQMTGEMGARGRHRHAAAAEDRGAK